MGIGGGTFISLLSNTASTLAFISNAERISSTYFSLIFLSFSHSLRISFDAFSLFTYMAVPIIIIWAMLGSYFDVNSNSISRALSPFAVNIFDSFISFIFMLLFMFILPVALLFILSAINFEKFTPSIILTPIFWQSSLFINICFIWLSFLNFNLLSLYMDDDSRKFLWVVVLFSLFFGVLNFLSLYVERNYAATCSSALPLSLIINLLISIALLSGTLVTLFFVNRSRRRKNLVHKDVLLTLNFLEGDERNIVKFLVDNKGTVTQSSIVKSLGLDKVKVARVLAKLESKGVVVREKFGNTNKVILVDGLKELFSCDVCSK